MAWLPILCCLFNRLKLQQERSHENLTSYFDWMLVAYFSKSGCVSARIRWHPIKYSIPDKHCQAYLDTNKQQGFDQGVCIGIILGVEDNAS